MKVPWVLSCLMVAATAGRGYKLDPLASKIKAAEDRIFAEVPEMEPRIVGGVVAREHTHPYLVGLITYGVRDIAVCGSSLVSPMLLVTAAHCVQDVLIAEAVLGSPYLFHGGTRVNTTEFVVHPKYDSSVSLDYDIGVVILPVPVEFTDDIKPISLPETPEEAEFIGEWGEALGWGYTSDSKSFVATDAVVYRVRLRIVAVEECTRDYSHIDVKKNVVCTSGLEGVGTCGGDSGGPLVVRRNARKILICQNTNFSVTTAGRVFDLTHAVEDPEVPVGEIKTGFQVGLTSFGDVECEVQKPSVFTRVASYLDFIQQYL